MTNSPTALQSARELLAEASSQYASGHLARACRLAAASIEQTDKCLRAFERQNRFLPEAAPIMNRLLSVKGHARMIRFACTDWIWDNVKGYSDLAISGSNRCSRQIVRQDAARNCVVLAENRLADALSRIAVPQFVERFHDRLFAMDARQFQRILATDDFWWYYIARLQPDKQDWAEAVLDYDLHYLAGGTLFRAPQA
jgi:hypothetical protein